jgi:GNAT superfamily N-acetyltransferase
MSCKEYEIKSGEKIIGNVVWCGNKITNLNVDREFRRKVYGKSLLVRAGEQIQKARYQHSYVLTYTIGELMGNDELKSFYAKCGYHPFPFYAIWRYGLTGNHLIKYFK